MDRKSCLNCKYEPEWGDPVGLSYPRRYGYCKYVIGNLVLPACYTNIRQKAIERYSDDSGVFYDCNTWEPKGK